MGTLSTATQKAKWDALRGHQWDKRGRVAWPSSRAGTFEYHKQKPHLYGALRTRREMKIARKIITKRGFRGEQRRALMRNLMGVAE